MRPVTWLLRRPTAHFRQVLTWLSENEPRLLRELLTAVTEEGLNEKHVEGGRLLEAAVKSMGGVKGGHASLLSSTIDLTDSTTGPNKAAPRARRRERLGWRRRPEGGNQRSSEAIIGHQRSSEVISVHQSPSESSSEAISAAIRGHQRPSEAYLHHADEGGNQRSSDAIRGHQRPSEAYLHHADVVCAYQQRTLAIAATNAAAEAAPITAPTTAHALALDEAIDSARHMPIGATAKGVNQSSGKAGQYSVWGNGQVRGLGVGQVERNVQQCKNGKPSLFLKWKLAPGRKRELGVWRVLYLSGRLTELEDHIDLGASELFHS
eukprot:jgi/Chrpa1/10136/Chrysochromulina_OHIO_Genome00010133-RA